jgi:hypothetical protein
MKINAMNHPVRSPGGRTRRAQRVGRLRSAKIRRVAAVAATALSWRIRSPLSSLRRALPLWQFSAIPRGAGILNMELTFDLDAVKGPLGSPLAVLD